MNRIQVAVNGNGVIGKRVADAIALQEDMHLAGICDISADWRIKVASANGYDVFSFDESSAEKMNAAGIEVQGVLQDLLARSDIVVDCTPKNIAAHNIAQYKKANLKHIVHGGEKHEITGHSFSAENNYQTAFGRESTRVVSCNTTSIVRTLTALKRAGLLKKARGTLLRRATDPWESHLGGIMNTLVPERDIPSHQGPDAQTVDPDLDVITAAVKVPETLSHLHYWNVQLTRRVTKETVLEALASSTRTAFINYSDGLSANNAVKEMMLGMGRPYGDMYEVAIWEDMLKVIDDEVFYAYLVDNQAIVIPETIDAIRALTELEINSEKSIKKTNRSLGIRKDFFSSQRSFG
ncbi:MAG: type II glyceraldehyde-3-phosphate dehydrogenase [Acidobacteria bacterium]|nr:MAG: type II glyceraldehyde-3-phosphate dehydrogenase [Acidobacteriota bacterium]REJ98268.1 MAG: type II glyceraldehyde-3-phosphate dehydrogenase [Acidobacteriota bacterium]REK17012.1 MAG: type II glyceraldehyde-3-phosphate dehydrogenase [Acidobacteriota bacterium]REK42922.1 MAG: type II glyceraldehyde-3-phosphate dehydrogenase [Acidobacteriota bacterium]